MILGTLNRVADKYFFIFQKFPFFEIEREQKFLYYKNFKLTDFFWLKFFANKKNFATLFEKKRDKNILYLNIIINYNF